MSCGLALAEMIAGLSKPTVALVVGDSHSIGVPLSVAADYTVIAPSATVIIHPAVSYTHLRAHEIEQWMITPGILSRDLGTILVGRQAVEAGLYQCVGGIHEALQELQQRIAKNRTDICS